MKTNPEPNRGNIPAANPRLTWQFNVGACLCGVAILCIGFFGKDIYYRLIKDAMPSPPIYHAVEQL